MGASHAADDQKHLPRMAQSLGCLSRLHLKPQTLPTELVHCRVGSWGPVRTRVPGLLQAPASEGLWFWPVSQGTLGQIHIFTGLRLREVKGWAQGHTAVRTRGSIRMQGWLVPNQECFYSPGNWAEAGPSPQLQNGAGMPRALWRVPAWGPAP